MNWPAIILLCVAGRVSAAGLYGFSDAEIQKAKAGAVLSKELKESSEKELAGVVLIFFHKPVGELSDILLEGGLLKSDETIRDFHVWKPQEAAPEMGKLKTRYEAYRKNGLKAAGKPGEELELAIKETLPANYAKALLSYPADSPLEHRFFFYRQDSTSILSHRARQGGLITEQRYYVSQTYDCRFIASQCVGVPDGTLLYYANCTFTDQVAGLGSSMKHSIGRKRMLADVTASLKRAREQLESAK